MSDDPLKNRACLKCGTYGDPHVCMTAGIVPDPPTREEKAFEFYGARLFAELNQREIQERLKRALDQLDKLPPGIIVKTSRSLVIQSRRKTKRRVTKRRGMK